LRRKKKESGDLRQKGKREAAGKSKVVPIVLEFNKLRKNLEEEGA